MFSNVCVVFALSLSLGLGDASVFVEDLFLKDDSGLGIPSVVNTDSGSVRGWERASRDGRLYQAWTKVPFAEPPVGKLRLKAPVPVRKWAGILNATEEIPLCIQAKGGVENCLYLNVFRPKIPIRNLPVLAYVHGGSFQALDVGPRESADYLMDEDVVLVQISYRLNGFGFMTFGDTVMPGNFGLKDQAMALKWVQQNIAAFGGDPKSVTVFGGSAGGASTHFLLKSPLCEDLVTRAVSHSGTINHVWSLFQTERVTATSMNVVKLAGCSRRTNEEILDCLQKVDAKALLMAIGQANMMEPPGSIPFVPVIEPIEAEMAFATEDLSLRPSNKPWITSTSNGEYQLFVHFAALLPKPFFANITLHLREYLEDLIGTHIPVGSIKAEGSESLEKTYFPEKLPLDEFIVAISKLYMDSGFIFPAIQNALKHLGPKWVSRMEYKGELSGIDPVTEVQTPDKVAGHDDEKFYYFNYRSRYTKIGPHETPEDLAVSRRLIKYLVNFAYYDDPTPPNDPLKWNQFTENQVLRITAEGDFEADQLYYTQLENVLNMWAFYYGWN